MPRPKPEKTGRKTVRLSSVGVRDPRPSALEEDLEQKIRDLIAEELGLLELADAVGDVSKEGIKGTGGEDGKDGEAGPEGPPGAGASLALYEVQSAATGDGLYNCYEQKIDATDYAKTDGTDKLDDLNSTNKVVLNLLENDPEATYKECLATKDRLVGFEKYDDESIARIIGVPIAGCFVRRAITTQAAPADTKITANLYDNTGTEVTSGLGSGVDVYCSVIGGGNLNAAVPRLEDNDDIFVMNWGGKWWCITLFNASQEC